MHGDRGLSNGVQVTLLFPVAFGILLLTLQWAMVSWADATALAAAQDGARAAAVIDGSAAVGESLAREASENGSLDAVAVVATRGATRTTVTVSGQAVSLLPGYSASIRKSAEAPTQRLTRG